VIKALSQYLITKLCTNQIQIKQLSCSWGPVRALRPDKHVPQEVAFCTAYRAPWDVYLHLLSWRHTLASGNLALRCCLVYWTSHIHSKNLQKYSGLLAVWLEYHQPTLQWTKMANWPCAGGKGGQIQISISLMILSYIFLTTIHKWDWQQLF
jgi:hypothetical protein